MARLTDAYARKAIGDGTDRVHWDDHLKGFGLRVTPGGAKRWVCRYRANGKERRVSFGNPAVVSAKDARSEAKRTLSRAALGSDPWAERKAQREQATANKNTLRAVIDQWMADRRARGKWRPNTIDAFTRITENVLLPRWNDRPIDSITRREVKEMHRALAKTPVAANRAVACLSAIYGFAMDEELVESNPCTRIERFPEQPRERIMSREELRRLWAALRKAPVPWGSFFRLLILTGCRVSELRGLEWEQVSLKDGTIHLPAAKTKAKKARAVALSGAARAELEVLAQDEDRGPFVFGRELTRKSQRGAWKRLLDAANIEGLQVHDLRRSKATFALNADVPGEVVAKMIGDTKDVTQAVYARVMDETVRAAEDRTQEALIAEAQRATRLR